MQALIEIVRVLMQKKVKDTDIFNEKIIRDQEKRYYLYQGIRDGQYRNDDDAASSIYNVDKSDPKYQQLKSRLRRQLLQALFVFDMKTTEQTPYQIAVYECTISIACAQILVTNGAWTAASSLSREILTKALKFHLSDIAWQSLKILRDFEVRRGNMRSYEKYSRQLKDLARQRDADVLSGECMDQFMLIYGKTVSDKPENMEQMRELTESMKRNWINTVTCTTTLNYFRAEIYFNMSIHHYTKAFSFCRQADEYLTRNSHLSSRPRLGEFAGLAILCSIHEREYTTAEELLSRYQDYLVEGTGNWGLFMSNHFLVAMHTGKYIEAAHILQKVLHHKGFTSFLSLQQEKWYIYRMFLDYIVRIGWASIPDHLQKDVSLGHQWYEHLNNLSIASKDKQGMNIILYILQTLFILEESGLEGGYTRLEPLRQYTNIHLKNRDYTRSHAFLKMLFILIDCELDVDRAEKRTQKYYDVLMSADETGRRMEGLEVVPYEKLWEIVVWRVCRKG